MSLTKQEKINEILKCGKDPIYFINTYVKIQHPVRGRIPFETYDFQDDVVRQIVENRFNIVLKSRQLGLSTIAAAYAVWYAIFHKDKNILVIATKLETAINFIKKVKIALLGLPSWLLLPKFEQNKTEVTFNNGSQIKAVPTSDDAGRSEALSLLIVDEAAFIKNFEDIWTGLYPTISTGGRALVLSTPNGVGGQYYKLWVDGESGQNGFNTIKLPWWVHPEHDEAWFLKETKNLTKRKVAQEFLCVGENTKIITPTGYQFVQNLKKGDFVLTHLGRFQPIEAINSRLLNEDETYYEVTSPGNRKESFCVTGNHPTLSYRFFANQQSSLDYVCNNSVEQSWVEFDEIAKKRKTTDRIVNVLFPAFQGVSETSKIEKFDLSKFYESVDVNETSCRYKNQWGSTHRFVNVDYELGKFVGLYLAEGCKAKGGIDLGFHKDEFETHALWVENFLKALGCRTTRHNKSENNGCRVWTHNKHIGSFVRTLVFGELAHEKSLNFDLVVSLGKSFVKGLLVGHYLGDGNHKHDSKFSVFSTSSKLIYQLRTLNSAFGLYPRIGHDVRKNKNHNDMWYLEFQTDGTYENLLEFGQVSKKGSRTRFVNDSFVGHHKINRVATSCDGDAVVVYDLKVAIDRSFVAESAVLHNCDFLASGETFLQPENLEWLKEMVQDPILKAGFDRNVWVWAHPKPDTKYVISADIARGDGADFSAFHIVNADTSEVDVEYMGKAPPEVMGQLIDEWGRKYNDALAIPENNSFGYSTCIYLRDQARYPRLYYDKNKGDPFKFAPPDQKHLPGFSTQHKSRVNILTKFEELIRNKLLHSKSQRLIQQLQAFVWQGSKPQALRDSHDDLIISLAIAAYIVGGAYQIDAKQAAHAIAMLKATSIARRDQSQLPGDDVRPLVNPQITGMTPSNVYKPRDPAQVKHLKTRDINDFSWLLE